MNSGIKSADIMYFNKIMYLKFNFIYKKLLKWGELFANYYAKKKIKYA